MQPTVKRKPRAKNNKRRRLPNGFGQISEIKNRNLRNPFRAMVTVGKTPEGRPICKPLKPESYFPTYNDAYAALVEYNRNPYDLEASITVEELYDKWFAQYYESRESESGMRQTSSAWKYCTSVYTMRAADLRARHIKGCMENGTIVKKGIDHHPTPVVQANIKSLFNKMLDYAVEYEIVDRNFARTFSLPDEVSKEREVAKNPHIAFSDEEMELLWDNVEKKSYVDVILIQCYSGWRPLELCEIRLENVDFENWTFLSGSKTDAGRDRLVPIHSKIRRLVERRYNEATSIGSKYLFNCTEEDASKKDSRMTYRKYQIRFNMVRDELNLNPLHRPHDCRVQFVTMAKKYKLDEYAIKYIVGHKITDITEAVYTKRELDWFQSEMEKIK